MLPLAFMVVTDQERAVQGVKDAVKIGIRMLWIGRDAIEGRARSESAYDPLWAVLEEAGVPVTLHLGSGRNMGGARGRLNILPS
jgi:predicted TIM-barrel fold metal-dependent hydrolase